MTEGCVRLTLGRLIGVLGGLRASGEDREVNKNGFESLGKNVSLWHNVSPHQGPLDQTNCTSRTSLSMHHKAKYLEARPGV